LLITFSCESVSEYHPTNLLDLVCLSFRAYRLEIEDFFNVLLGKDVMATSYTFLEAQVPQQTA
jgi:hypothetical protein